ncbi:MAG: tyrosine-type recombinase/integrase [Faecalibacterium sp.]
MGNRWTRKRSQHGFRVFLEEHGLPAVHFHSLRHTNASLLIAAHIPITTVSGRLGHAQTSTTLNFYASAIQSADAAAADALEGVIKIREKAHA